MIMKKRIAIPLIATFLTAGIFLAPTPAVYASEIPVLPATETLEERAEETVWKYRNVDGKLQKRLWSLTYGKWITEWEWV